MIKPNDLPLAPQAKAARDPYEELLYKTLISNSILLIQFQLQRNRRPKGAKLAQLVNQDFLLNFDRYMEEINGPIVMGTVPTVELEAMVENSRRLLHEALTV